MTEPQTLFLVLTSFWSWRATSSAWARHRSRQSFSRSPAQAGMGREVSLGGCGGIGGGGGGLGTGAAGDSGVLPLSGDTAERLDLQTRDPCEVTVFGQ